MAASNGRKYLFTSESVTEGHPDKICDQISDAVLDAVLAEDPRGRVACEAMVKDDAVYVAGEITTSAKPDIEKLVRQTVGDIGYTDPDGGFTADTCQLKVNLTRQSADIDMGVGTGGAGDQGLMFGYACNETAELMPFPIMMAHKLCLRLAEVRRMGILDFVRPDGKSQVTVEYEDSKPVRVDAVVVSTQHSDSVTNETLREGVLQCVIRPVLPVGTASSRSCPSTPIASASVSPVRSGTTTRPSGARPGEVGGAAVGGGTIATVGGAMVGYGAGKVYDERHR